MKEDENDKGEAEEGEGKGPLSTQSPQALTEFFKYTVSVESVSGVVWLSISSSLFPGTFFRITLQLSSRTGVLVYFPVAVTRYSDKASYKRNSSFEQALQGKSMSA